MPDELTTDQLAQNAMNPKEASGDQGSVKMHDLDKQEAVLDRKQADVGVRKRGFGLRFARIVPGGTQ